MKYSFSKQDTNVVKGIAIALLMLHHCFMSVDRFEEYTISFAPFTQDFGMGLAQVAKCCVGIFTFLSAYGMTKSYLKRDSGLNFSAQDTEHLTLHRYVNLISGFVFTFAVCSIASFLIPTCGYNSVDCYLTKGYDELSPIPVALLYLLFDLFGVSELLGTPSLLHTWWYIGLALALIIFMPFLLSLYRRFGWLLAPAVPLLLCVSGVEPTLFSKWLPMAPIGILFAHRSILERWKGWVRGRTPALRLLHFVVLSLVIGGLAYFEVWNFDRELSYIAIVLDIAITVTVIGWIFLYLSDLPGLSAVLQFFGRHSLNIFLAHNFIRSRWFEPHIYSFRHFALVTLVLLLEATALSVVIELAKKYSGYNRLVAATQSKLDQRYAG